MMKSILNVMDRAAVYLTFIVVVGTWELSVRVMGISDIVLPAPSHTVVSLYRGLFGGPYLRNFYYTMLETTAGFLIAGVSGILLGALISQIGWVRRAVYPYVVGFQTVPKIAIAPLLVIWFGFGLTSKIVIAAMVAFFPIIVNTIEGLNNADSGRIEMMRSFGASRWQVFRRVQFPSALPFIFAGLDAGIVLALLGAVVGEFVGSQVGLGNLILNLNFRMDIAGVFAVLVLLSVVGVALHMILVAIQRKVVFWAESSKKNVVSA